jgi:hypothetical protein
VARQRLDNGAETGVGMLALAELRGKQAVATIHAPTPMRQHPCANIG